MDRKEFLKQSAKLGGCCGLAVLAGALPGISQNKPSTRADQPDPGFSPCEYKIEHGQSVIKRIIGQLDQSVDQRTREKIMQACGRQCHDQGSGGTKRVPTPEEARANLERARKLFKVEEVGEETVIHVKYSKNSRGLKNQDGYCFCPIFEIPPKDLSSTFCMCSVGYLTAEWEQQTGKPVKVELVDSLLRGGKECSFRVRFKE